MKKTILSLIVLMVPAIAIAQSGRTHNDAAILKFEQFYTYLNELYIDPLDNDKLIEDAIKNVLSDLDPHSSYSSAEEMRSISESFGGSFSGIGVEFDILRDTLTVVNAIQGGPAESLGVLAGDKILAIDGDSSIGISRADVPKRLRGPKGTVVVIDILRRGNPDILTFRITRDNIAIHTVDAAYMAGPGIGYIKVNRFAETTMSEFYEAFDKLGEVNSLILDLRGNGGGLLDKAIELSEFFLPARALIVSTQGRSGKEIKALSRRNGRFTKGNVVVLLDHSSASGSEIVAGAVQDWDRGILIGQPTFGKGLVQRQLMLIDGSAVRITVARYHTPCGRVIQRPYTQGNQVEYYIDHYKRAYDQNYADSVNLDRPAYRTLKSGRTVYGGGGITPDIIVPLDTTRNYSYWNRLSRAGVINEYINTYLESDRPALEAAYPTFEVFSNEYQATPAILGGIMSLGAERNVESEGQTLDTPEFHSHIKALVAQKLWGTNEYYRIINGEDDAVFGKAVEVLANWKDFAPLLE